ncbi:MAG: hypothetical protein LUG65_07785 [Clostridiales bacterium]|nr:hypothetical protein [Clostridiales bacterium]
MAKVYYDPARMKSGAEAIEKELKTFNAARERIEIVIDNLPWYDDPTSQSYRKRFNSDARPSMEDAADKMQQYADLLRQASKKYANAIDSGNSNLSS